MAFAGRKYDSSMTSRSLVKRSASFRSHFQPRISRVRDGGYQMHFRGPMTCDVLVFQNFRSPLTKFITVGEHSCISSRRHRMRATALISPYILSVLQTGRLIPEKDRKSSVAEQFQMRRPFSDNAWTRTRISRVSSVGHRTGSVRDIVGTVRGTRSRRKRHKADTKQCQILSDRAS